MQCLFCVIWICLGTDGSFFERMVEVKTGADFDILKACWFIFPAIKCNSYLTKTEGICVQFLTAMKFIE